MNPQAQTASRGAWSASGAALRVEAGTVAVAALVVVALLARLVGLDWMPLDPHEVAVSVPAWRAAQGAPGGAVTGAPLVFHAQQWLFWLLGGSDVQARLVGVLSGTALVAAAWALRPALGGPAALAAAALLALSPVWVFASRTVGGGTPAALALVVVLALWARAKRSHGVALAVAGAATLAAGGPGLAFLVALAAHAAIGWARGRRRSDLEGAAARWGDTRERRRLLLAFGLAFVLLATAALTRLDGLAAAIEQPVAWLRALSIGRGPAWSGFVLPLVAYAPVTAVFAAAGVVSALAGARPLERFVAVWAVVAAVLGLVAGTPAFVLEAALPLTLAAAVALGRLLEAVASRGRWAEDGVMSTILLAVVAYAGLQLFAFANAHDHAAGMAGPAPMLAAGAMLLGLLLFVTFLILWGADVALRVAGVTALAALSVVAWSNGTALNYRPATELREPLRPVYHAPGASVLARNVAAASWARTRDPHAWRVLAAGDLIPALGWPLRRHEVRWVGPRGTLEEPVVITVSGTETSFGPAPYRGRTHLVAGHWEPAFGTWHGFVRWWLQRRSAPGASTPRMTGADLYIIAE